MIHNISLLDEENLCVKCERKEPYYLNRLWRDWKTALVFQGLIFLKVKVNFIPLLSTGDICYVNFFLYI
jgi:hypothetical protein